MSLEKLSDVFRKTFDDDTLELTPTLSAKDVKDWDSFNHITLIVSLEEAFDVAFTTEEITGMQNVGDLVRILNAKGRTVSWS